MPLLISLLTTMTACGTIPFLIYFVLTRLFDSSICAALRYRIIKDDTRIIHTASNALCASGIEAIKK